MQASLMLSRTPGHARPGSSQSNAANQALREYRTMSLESRVASASAHALVLMLFERLLLHVRDARAALTDAPRRLRATERALALIDGLDATLDDRNGGEVAEGLHAVYALLRARLLEGGERPLTEAVDAVESLTDAWRRIAPQAYPA